MTNHHAWLSRATAVAAILLAASTSLAAGVSVDEASWADANAATEKYTAGKRAYDEGHLEEALARFHESYDVVASPNSHLMIARVLIDLGRHTDADHELVLVIEEAERVKKNPDKYAKAAEAARALRKQLQEKLGFLEVQMPGRVVVQGREVPPAQWGAPLAVPVGEVAVEIQRSDGTKHSETVTVEAGKTVTLRLVQDSPRNAPASAVPVAPPPPCPQSKNNASDRGLIKQRSVAYVVGGIGATGLVGFTVFGILDRKTFDDLTSKCDGKLCSEELHDDAERGRTYQALANVGLGVGIVGIGTAAALLITAPRRKAALHRRPTQVLVLPNSFAVAGSF